MATFTYPKTFKPVYNMRMRFYIRRAAKSADILIAVSNSTANEIKSILNVKENKIRIVENGINNYYFTPINERSYEILKKYKIKKPYIFSAGTLQPRKNISKLLEAYSMLPAESRKNYPLIHAGNFGWLYRDIFKTISRLNLEKDVRFLGYVNIDELKVLYENTFIFVYPSVYEGFGLPVIEAMACGAPVITSNRSSMKEIAEGSAVLVNPDSAEEISLAIKNMISDNKYRENFVIKGKARAMFYTQKKMAEKTIEIYRSM